LVIFSIGCLVRGIPELVAYPYPIGSDVINYYIPAVTFFDTIWPTILHQFPTYVFLLHIINIASGLTPYFTVIAVAVGVFGIFTMSVFFAAKKILKITTLQSTFLSIFVIFQTAVLMTTANNHKDIFALSTLLFTFILIHNRHQRNTGLQIVACALILTAITVTSDGMIGALFILLLIAYSFIAKTKIVILCTIVAIGFFAVTILPTENNLHRILHLNLTHQTDSGRTYSKYYIESNKYYHPTNLVILFLVINGFLIPAGVYGLYKVLRKRNGSLLLALPVLISIPLSLSWIIFPENTTLVANRWTKFIGIFLSILAAYGIIELIKRQKAPSVYKKITVGSSVLSLYLIIGIGYAIMPHEEPFILFDITKDYIRTLSTVTMQPDKKTHDKLLTAISWINDNTKENSIIVGQRQWRGHMNLTLDAQREWKDFGLSQYTSEQFFKVLDNYLVDHKNDRYIANYGNTYVVTQRTDFDNYGSNNLNYTKVYSGGYNIFKLQRTTNVHSTLWH
jgi:hypothetical protein